MKLDDFIDQLSGAALDIDEFAEAAQYVTNDPGLVNRARAYINAKVDFACYLDAVGVEIG